MFSLILGVNPVQLESLSVPPLVQNGTVPHVVLDCPLAVHCSCIMYYFYNCTLGVNPVQLESLSVPLLVHNGTVPHVVLDCPLAVHCSCTVY